MLNGAGLFTYIFVGSFLGVNVGKYTSPIEHLGLNLATMGSWKKKT